MKKDTRRRQVDRKIVEYFREGKSERWIKEQLGVGNGRLRRIKRQARERGYLDGTTELPDFPTAIFEDPIDLRSQKVSPVDLLLNDRKAWIIDRLEIGWRPITVFEELGSAVTRASFYRFLDRHNLGNLGRHYRKRVVPEIVHGAGEALILDWGKLRNVYDEETKKNKTLWAFVGVLGLSRYMMVRLVWTNDVPTTLAAIESMLQELGGAPRKITSDNPKCFAIEASKYEPILNPAIERFAAHYGITIECLPPSDPQKKGKVERLMSFTRRLYESHGNEWEGVEESQDFMNRKVQIANERKHGTTQRRPIDDFLLVETEGLKPLPAVAYEMEECADGKVRKDGHVRFANKYYSVEEKLIGEDVFILGSQKQVSIFHKGKLIEVHERLHDLYRSKQTKPHHLKPWEQAMREDSSYRKRALEIGPDVERLIVILLARGEGFIDTRKIWGILSLDKKYPRSAINEACRGAIELDSISYRTVLSLLNQSKLYPKEKPREEKRNTQNKFVRPLEVYREQIDLFQTTTLH